MSPVKKRYKGIIADTEQKCNGKFMNIAHRLDFFRILCYNKNVENRTVAANISSQAVVKFHFTNPVSHLLPTDASLLFSSFFYHSLPTLFPRELYTPLHSTHAGHPAAAFFPRTVLTFPPIYAIIKMWKTRRLPLTYVTSSREVLLHNPVSHLLRQTTHFFFLLSQISNTSDITAATAPIMVKIPTITEKTVICIAPFRDYFPRELYIRLHSAHAGHPAAVFLTIHRPFLLSNMTVVFHVHYFTIFPLFRQVFLKSPIISRLLFPSPH